MHRRPVIRGACVPNSVFFAFIFLFSQHSLYAFPLPYSICPGLAATGYPQFPHLAHTGHGAGAGGFHILNAYRPDALIFCGTLRLLEKGSALMAPRRLHADFYPDILTSAHPLIFARVSAFIALPVIFNILLCGRCVANAQHDQRRQCANQNFHSFPHLNVPFQFQIYKYSVNYTPKGLKPSMVSAMLYHVLTETSYRTSDTGCSACVL